MKELVHTFAIKAIKKSKPKHERAFVKIGKRCEAVVVSIDGTLKARLITSPVEECTELLVIPFTEDSFNLKGKTHIFLKEKDKRNHYICYIRDEFKAKLYPGSDTQFNSLVNGILVSGHVYRKDKQMYFKYENLLAFTEQGGRLNNIRFADDNTLIKK